MVVDLTARGQVVIAVSVGQLVERLRAEVNILAAPRETSVRVGRTTYRVLVTPDLEDGGLVAEVPKCPGCTSQGDTLAEARANLREALMGWLAVERGAVHKGRTLKEGLVRGLLRGGRGRRGSLPRRVLSGWRPFDRSAP